MTNLLYQFDELLNKLQKAGMMTGKEEDVVGSRAAQLR
jgi:hypothetical protein